VYVCVYEYLPPYDSLCSSGRNPILSSIYKHTTITHTYTNTQPLHTHTHTHRHHAPYIIYHTSSIIHHLHTSYIIHHTSYIIQHTAYTHTFSRSVSTLSVSCTSRVCVLPYRSFTKICTITVCDVGAYVCVCMCVYVCAV